MLRYELKARSGLARRIKPVGKGRSAGRRPRKRAGGRTKRQSKKTDVRPARRAGAKDRSDQRPLRNREQPAEEEALPQFYEPTRVVLLPVDPYLVFVYWELAADERERAEERLQGANPPARPVLRFHEVTNAHAPFDVDIELAAGNWYVHLWSPEQSYCAELGLKEEDGGFISLARSNIAHTPRAGPSARVEERYVSAAAVEERHQGAPQRAEPVPVTQMENAAAPKGSGEPPAKPPDLIAPLAAEKRQPAEVPVAEHVGAAGETQPARLQTPARIGSEETLPSRLAELHPVRRWPAPPEVAAPNTWWPPAETLRGKLRERYAVRQWLAFPREGAPATWRPPSERPPSERPHSFDLTDMNEASMALGCSSGPSVRRKGEI